MKKLLAVYGSPRNGNTDILLDWFLKGAEDSEYQVENLYLRDIVFSPCRECGGCEKTGQCVIQDDLSSVFLNLSKYRKMVMAFWVFFLGPPALVKGFIDRAQVLWVRKNIQGKDVYKDRNRRGFLISTCGYRKKGGVFSCNR